MSWVRLDDHFPAHRKLRRASDAAFRLHVSALCWSNANLTDGVVPVDELRLVSDVLDPQAAADELVALEVWHYRDGGEPWPECCFDDDRDPAPAGSAWLLHAFLEFQPSAASIRARREARVRAGRAGGVRSGVVRKQKASKDEASREANASPLAEAHAEAQAKQNRTPSRPVPSRPTAATAAAAAAAVAIAPRTTGLPDDVARLADRLAADGVTVGWDLRPADLAEVQACLARVGERELVRYAKSRFRPDAPAFSAKAFLAGWQSLRGRPALEVVQQPCPVHRYMHLPCGSCAADAKAAPDDDEELLP